MQTLLSKGPTMIKIIPVATTINNAINKTSTPHKKQSKHLIRSTISMEGKTCLQTETPKLTQVKTQISEESFSLY